MEDVKPHHARKLALEIHATHADRIGAAKEQLGAVSLRTELLNLRAARTERFSAFSNDSWLRVLDSAAPIDDAEDTQNYVAATTFSRQQIATVGALVYAERMRHFLNSQFPESEAIAATELDRVILELTDRALDYKLTQETHVAPFVVSAWLMGVDFDAKFIAVKKVLEDLDMDSGAKAAWLWRWLQRCVAILETGRGGRTVSP